jgi:hypothetical protein
LELAIERSYDEVDPEKLETQKISQHSSSIRYYKVLGSKTMQNDGMLLVAFASFFIPFLCCCNNCNLLRDELL